jgi:MoaA/NifB/PqqE/SkfB family radical SAM enzyme
MLQLLMAPGHCGKVNKNKKHNIQCPMPFLHYNIKLDRKSTACYRCLENLGDYTKNSLMDIWHGDAWKNFRLQHLRGERPAGCMSCWELEDKGVSSTRTLVLEEYQKEIAELETLELEDLIAPAYPQDMELRFGTLCNLQCRHCSPTYSSQWATGLKKHKKASWETYIKQEGIDLSLKTDNSITSLPDNTVADLKQLAPGLKYFKVTGGESLMHPLHYKMLDAFQDKEQNITLEYNTNLHYLGLGNVSVIDYWKKYKQIICRVSIDSDEQNYEYMRTNGNIDRLKENWNILEKEFHDEIRTDKFDLHATCTVNPLNITRIPQTLEFFSSLNSRFHISLVQYPDFMDICNLPDGQKETIILQCKELISNMDTYVGWCYTARTAQIPSKYRSREYVRRYNIKNLEKIISWLERTPKTEFDKQFSWWMKKQDEMNGTNLFDYYPEYEYLRDHYEKH